MKNTALEISPSDLRRSGSGSGTETFAYFILTVLGFTFWFAMAVPFASHRETYSWLATINSHDFAYAFKNSMSVTYRPLSQATTWLAFLILDPGRFPTSTLRQLLLQLFVYGMFVIGWWLIYRKTGQRRVLALVAFVAAGTFFSGYVHLFHIYGIMYVPVMLILGALLGLHGAGTFEKEEVWLSALSMLLALWHPFVTALFVGFYFGLYIETFPRRSKIQHMQALIVLLVGAMVSLGFGVLFARHDASTMTLHDRLLGFLISYKTNEVNLCASLLAFLLSLAVVLSMELSRQLKIAVSLLVTVISAVFVLKSLPLLLLWVGVVLIKLVHMRSWGLFFLMVAAALLPLGGGIGTPIFALMAIIVAVYATALGWLQAEQVLSTLKTRYVIAAIILLTIVVVLVRAGIRVPVVTKAAAPLLVERERTYQLETILAWLQKSEYCRYRIAFAANGGSPIDSLDNVFTRRNRPPSDIDDVTKFWNKVLSCGSDHSRDNTETAVVTFNGPAPDELTPVFEVAGTYAGKAVVWVPNESRKQTAVVKTGSTKESSFLSSKR